MRDEGKTTIKELISQILLLICSFNLVVLTISCDAQNVIDLNANITYQTITGWEATAQAGGQAGAAVFFKHLFPLYKDSLYDLVVNEAGINRLQVTVRCGYENPTDYYQQFLDGTVDHDTWSNHRYQIVNDDGDPFSINWNGFQFTELDCTMNSLVVPIKNRIEANNESLYFHLDYVDFDNSTFEHYTNPEEYAEFILASFLHLQSQYGFVPDAMEVKLEPDNNGGWDDNGIKLASAMVAAGQRLANNGFYPDFIAPSTIRMDEAIVYFDGMIQNPSALQYLTELSYHRYGGVSISNLQQIASRGSNYGLNTAMLEWWKPNNSYKTLHEDLKIGNNSAWQQGTVAFFGNPPTSFYIIDTTNVNNPVANIHPMTKFTRQYYKFIRAGAVRIEASTTNNNFDPLAFINTNGKYVVVVKADQSGTIAIQDLPSNLYGIKYTTDTQYDVDLPDVNVNSGDTLSTSIPAQGVITIYAKGAAGLTPDINVIPTSHDYGEVQLGDSSSQTFELSNTGTANLHITESNLEGLNANEFSIASGGGMVTIPPNQTHDLSVDFSPATMGIKEATLSISSDDPDEDPFEVMLEGMGIDSSVHVSNFKNHIPLEFGLNQNYPNPFNPSTTIEFEIPKQVYVDVAVYDLQGQLIQTLLSKNLPVGYYSVIWDGSNSDGVPVSSGIYFYQIKTRQFNDFRKMVLIR